MSQDGITRHRRRPSPGSVDRPPPLAGIGEDVSFSSGHDDGAGRQREKRKQQHRDRDRDSNGRVRVSTKLIDRSINESTNQSIK